MKIIDFVIRRSKRMALEKAIDRCQILPSYQPIVSATFPHQIIGCEALARWFNKSKAGVIGVMAPDSFIPDAERWGLISKLDLLIARVALHDLKEWQTSGIAGREFIMSTNLSSSSLNCTSTIQELLRSVKEAQLISGTFQIEISEKEIENIDSSKLSDHIQLLKSEGVVIALDDFSAGNSSIAKLITLPIDTLKIDKQVISDGGTREKKISHLFVTHIALLANQMGIRCILEGLETVSHTQRYNKYGITEFQGYWFGMPTLREEFSLQYLQAKPAHEFAPASVPVHKLKISGGQKTI